MVIISTALSYRTQLVGYSRETVSEIKKCIDDWIIAGKATGQTFTLGSSNLTVSCMFYTNMHYIYIFSYSGYLF